MDDLIPYRYEYMHLGRLQKIIAECPILIQPTGVLEWHGKHNALGCDGLIAKYICERVMDKLRCGVLMPVNWVATYGFIHYPGTVCYSGDVTTNIFAQMLREHVKLGFKLIFLISGHGGNWQMGAIKKGIEEVRQEVKKTHKTVEIVGGMYNDFAPGINVGHATEAETSLLLRVGQAVGIDLVDMKQFHQGGEEIPLYSLANENNVAIHENSHWDWKNDLNDPAICSAAIGEQMIATCVEGILAEIAEYREELKI